MHEPKQRRFPRARLGRAGAERGRALLATPVEILGLRSRRRRQLTDARAFVHRVLASDSTALAACGPRTVIARTELTSTDMAVVIVSPPAEPPCAVFKLPMSARAVDGLLRESRALAALHADERLGEWRRLVPVSLASGALEGRQYRVDAALPGRVVLDQLRDETSRRPLLEAAAATIHVLHRATASAVEVDDRLAAGWVDAPANDLLVYGAARGLESQLGALRDELRAALVGRSLSPSWIHGDYWFGNLLFEVGEARPRGIVDWDAAGEPALPVIDVLHLLLYTRRLITGQELGEIVAEALRGRGWGEGERDVLDRYGTWCHAGSVSERQLLLLGWLRHVAHHARQQGNDRRPSYRRWQSWNVRPVLASL
jgi:aminoglycoside phosphotransferase (APT) family kinase protein